MGLRDVVDSEKVELIGSNMSVEEMKKYAGAHWSVNHKAVIVNGGLPEAAKKLLDSLEDVAPEQLVPQAFCTTPQK